MTDIDTVAPSTIEAAGTLLADATPPAPPALDDHPFLCFCGQDWWYHNRAHSDFQLMTRIARGRKVLLVNSIGMRMPLPGRSTVFFRRVFRKLGSMMKLLKRPLPERPDYWVMTPFMLPFYGIAWVRRLSAWLVHKQVRLAMWRAGIKKPHIFVTVPTALPIARRLDKSSLIYNRSDKHSAFEEADQGFIRELEDGLMRDADLVLYVSRELQTDEKSRTGEKSYFLDHGVDLEHFQRRDPSEEPADLRDIPHPRLGFFGGLDDYTVDFDLLEKVATDLPEAHVVLIGRAMCSMERFEKYDNVHFLDFKEYAQIPAYGSGFDVALMPWLRNEWIEHCNPIKLKEYLALGLDVVTTDFPEARHYADWMRIGKDPDDFVAKIRDTLDSGGVTSSKDLRASVASSTWDARTHELLAAATKAAR